MELHGLPREAESLSWQPIASDSLPTNARCVLSKHSSVSAMLPPGPFLQRRYALRCTCMHAARQQRGMNDIGDCNRPPDGTCKKRCHTH